jgi:hypothetical protein
MYTIKYQNTPTTSESIDFTSEVEALQYVGLCIEYGWPVRLFDNGRLIAMSVRDGNWCYLKPVKGHVFQKDTLDEVKKNQKMHRDYTVWETHWNFWGEQK